MGIKYLDIAVIGGGASGCIAALKAAENNDLKIGIIEKEDILLKKVIASGNGRCNIANMNCEGIEELLSYFESLGIFTVCEDEGRLYPRTKYSRTVTEAIERELAERNVNIFTGINAEAIETDEYGFKISAGKEVFMAKKLLLSAGGKAGPQFGTTGDSYRFLKKFGHTVTTLRPALSALECNMKNDTLKGIRCDAYIHLEKLGKVTGEGEKGEIQFTKDGLSGICVMNLSRYVILDRDVSMKEAYMRYEAVCDFVPEISKERLEKMIGENRDCIYGLLRRPLADYICEDEEDEKVLAGRIKEFKFTVTGSKGWKEAQVTSGGVSLDEIDMNTMESVKVPGLFVAGEALDIDGPCGGYNLFNAWTTGIRAGKAMAECTE